MKSLVVALCLLFTGTICHAQKTVCDNYLPLSLVQHICGDIATEIDVKVDDPEMEDANRCNRVYGLGRASADGDHLSFTVTDLQRYAEVAQRIQELQAQVDKQFDFKILKELGDRGFRAYQFYDADKLGLSVVIFQLDTLLVELKYYDYQKDLMGGFILQIDTLEELARAVYLRMLDQQ